MLLPEFNAGKVVDDLNGTEHDEDGEDMAWHACSQGKSRHYSWKKTLEKEAWPGSRDPEEGEDVATAIADKLSADSAAVWRRRKNFIALSIGFLLIYTAFRSIQALQSSINASGRLGVIAMTCVHGCMAAVCPLLAPTVAAGRPPPKWTVVLAAVLYVAWMTANLWPHPLTLLPTSLVAGVAQCIGWAAQIAFMRSFQHDEDCTVTDPDDDNRGQSTENIHPSERLLCVAILS